jgi:uncharacterized protein involved in exopolysaccharide biosynthesis
VAAVAGLGALVVAGAAPFAPRVYVAQAQLLVRIGQEYVYQPMLGGAGQALRPNSKRSSTPKCNW